MRLFLEEAMDAFVTTGSALLLGFFVVVLSPIWFPLWAWRKLTCPAVKP